MGRFFCAVFPRKIFCENERPTGSSHHQPPLPRPLPRPCHTGGGGGAWVAWSTTADPNRESSHRKREDQRPEGFFMRGHIPGEIYIYCPPTPHTATSGTEPQAPPPPTTDSSTRPGSSQPKPPTPPTAPAGQEQPPRQPPPRPTSRSTRHAAAHQQHSHPKGHQQPTGSGRAPRPREDTAPARAKFEPRARARVLPGDGGSLAGSEAQKFCRYGVKKSTSGGLGRGKEGGQKTKEGANHWGARD